MFLQDEIRNGNMSSLAHGLDFSWVKWGVGGGWWSVYHESWRYDITSCSALLIVLTMCCAWSQSFVMLAVFIASLRSWELPSGTVSYNKGLVYLQCNRDKIMTKSNYLVIPSGPALMWNCSLNPHVFISCRKKFKPWTIFYSSWKTYRSFT